MEDYSSKASRSAAPRVGRGRRIASRVLTGVAWASLVAASLGVAGEIHAGSKSHNLQKRFSGYENAYAGPSGVFSGYVEYLRRRNDLGSLGAPNATGLSSYLGVEHYLNAAAGLLSALRLDGHPAPGAERTVKTALNAYTYPGASASTTSPSLIEVGAVVESAVADRWSPQTRASLERIVTDQASASDERTNGVRVALLAAFAGVFAETMSIRLSKPYKPTS